MNLNSSTPVTINKIKKEFPIFKHHPKLVYLDSAASTQTPQVVIDAMDEYYKEYRANIHRGVYKLSGEATEKYEAARRVVANFMQAESDEIVFTSGTTMGLNMLAQSLGKELKKGDNVVLTRMEHHANLVPWIEMSKQYGFEIRWIEINDLFCYFDPIRQAQGKLRGDTGAEWRNLSHSKPANQDSVRQDSSTPPAGSGRNDKGENIFNVIDQNTKIVSVTHVSNALGTINPIEEIITASKKVGAITIIDAAQSVPHMPIDVKKLDCDALVFSGHKVYGPTGIGVCYAKKKLLEKMDPFLHGGDMIKEVTYDGATWNDIPWKFEAGTTNIAGAIGLAVALQFVENIGFDVIQKHEKELTEYALEKLREIKGLKIVGFESGINHVGVISFTIDNIHPHDIASILDTHNVAVRAGHHCTMPLMKLLGLNGTTRASFGIYNTKEDVDLLLKGLAGVKKIFHST